MTVALEARNRSSKAPATAPRSPEKTYVSSDDLYRRSSQYQLWSFSADQLAEMRRSANEKGRITALDRFATACSTAEAENSAVFATHRDKLTADILELISVDEEQVILKFICLQIVQICAHFKMPTQVRATAMAFFRRFYLVHSVMEYRPKNVAYTIVFLAAKLENYFILIDSFCAHIPKTKAEDILGLEFIILQTLQFTLLVHHPFRPLWGFFLDFQLVLLHPLPVMYDVSVDTLGRLYDQAKTWLNEHAVLSDAVFLFTPPQIALAAFYECDKRITDRYLRLKFLEKETLDTIVEEDKQQTKSQSVGATNGQREESNGQNDIQTGAQQLNPVGKNDYELLVSTIKACIAVAKAEVPTSREESAKIDERCFFILSPQKLLKKRIKALAVESAAESSAL